MVRRLGNKIKTGTARIALSAESKNDFKLGLTILPVGLNYTQPTDFRGNILINVGEHIKVAAYESEYKANPKQAVIRLTKDLEDRMRELLLDTEDEIEELMVERMAILLNSKYPLPLKDNFLRTKKLIAKLDGLQVSRPTKYTKLAEKTETVFEQLDEMGVKASSLFANTNRFLQIVEFVLGLPIFIYGWVNNFLANFIPALAAKKIKIYIGYTSTIKIMLGLFTYPIFYGLQIYLAHTFLGNQWLTLAYIISLPLTGLFAWSYRKRYLKQRAIAKWNHVRKEQSSEADSLLDAKNELTQQLETLIQ